MKYVPKLAFRVRLPTGEERTVFTRGSLTVREVLGEFGLEDCSLEYQGRKLERGAVVSREVPHDAVLVARKHNTGSAKRRAWYARLLADRGK